MTVVSILSELRTLDAEALFIWLLPNGLLFAIVLITLRKRKAKKIKLKKKHYTWMLSALAALFVLLPCAGALLLFVMSTMIGSWNFINRIPSGVRTSATGSSSVHAGDDSSIADGSDSFDGGDGGDSGGGGSDSD